MKHKFEFDKRTGTMVPTVHEGPHILKANVRQEEIREKKVEPDTKRPEFQQEKRIEVKTEAPNVGDTRTIKMQRVDRASSVQLLDDGGRPEAYLDSVSSGVVMFRERQDYDICQIMDEHTGKVLAYIGGYALQINFNMAELTTLERIEQCLDGITKLFRHKIMTQQIGRKPQAD